MRKSDIHLLVLICLFYPCLPKPPSQEKVERRKRGQASESPKPLPARRRKLTLFSFENEQQKQLQSLFFTKLPAEIRRQIYLEVLWPGAGSNEVHVASSHRRVCSVPCFEKHHDLTGWQHACWSPEARDGTRILCDPRVFPERPHEDRAIPFLSSCRRMYAFPLIHPCSLADSHGKIHRGSPYAIYQQYIKCPTTQSHNRHEKYHGFTSLLINLLSAY